MNAQHMQRRGVFGLLGTVIATLLARQQAKAQTITPVQETETDYLVQCGNHSVDTRYCHPGRLRLGLDGYSGGKFIVQGMDCCFYEYDLCARCARDE